MFQILKSFLTTLVFFQNSCTGREHDIGDVVSVSGDVVSYPDVVEGDPSVVSNILDSATTQQDRSEPNDGSVCMTTARAGQSL